MANEKGREQLESERDDELVTQLRRSAAEQKEAISVLEEVAGRLEKLSEELRKRGAYPIAGQLDRDITSYVRERANGLPHGE